MAENGQEDEEIIMVNPTRDTIDYWTSLIEDNTSKSIRVQPEDRVEVNLFENANAQSKTRLRKRDARKRIRTILENSAFPPEQLRRAIEGYSQNASYMNISVDKIDPRTTFIFDIDEEAWVTANQLEKNGLLKNVNDVEFDKDVFNKMKEANSLNEYQKELREWEEKPVEPSKAEAAVKNNLSKQQMKEKEISSLRQMEKDALRELEKEKEKEKEREKEYEREKERQREQERKRTKERERERETERSKFDKEKEKERERERERDKDRNRDHHNIKREKDGNRYRRDWSEREREKDGNKRNQFQHQNKRRSLHPIAATPRSSKTISFDKENKSRDSRWKNLSIELDEVQSNENQANSFSEQQKAEKKYDTKQLAYPRTEFKNRGNDDYVVTFSFVNGPVKEKGNDSRKPSKNSKEEVFTEPRIPDNQRGSRKDGIENLEGSYKKQKRNNEANYKCSQLSKDFQKSSKETKNHMEKIRTEREYYKNHEEKTQRSMERSHQEKEKEKNQSRLSDLFKRNEGGKSKNNVIQIVEDDDFEEGQLPMRLSNGQNVKSSKENERRKTNDQSLRPENRIKPKENIIQIIEDAPSKTPEIIIDDDATPSNPGSKIQPQSKPKNNIETSKPKPQVNENTGKEPQPVSTGTPAVIPNQMPPIILNKKNPNELGVPNSADIFKAAFTTLAQFFMNPTANLPEGLQSALPMLQNFRMNPQVGFFPNPVGMQNPQKNPQMFCPQPSQFPPVYPNQPMFSPTASGLPGPFFNSYPNPFLTRPNEPFPLAQGHKPLPFIKINNIANGPVLDKTAGFKEAGPSESSNQQILVKQSKMNNEMSKSQKPQKTKRLKKSKRKSESMEKSDFSEEASKEQLDTGETSPSRP